jgi:hypothetical protein
MIPRPFTNLQPITHHISLVRSSRRHIASQAAALQQYSNLRIYKYHKTSELLRNYVLYNLMKHDYVVDNAHKLYKVSRTVLGKSLNSCKVSLRYVENEKWIIVQLYAVLYDCYLFDAMRNLMIAFFRRKHYEQACEENLRCYVHCWILYR